MIIYCATNKINNIKYVGQTTGPLKERWKSHCKANSYLGRAIRKYGENNFSKGIIEKCSSIEELNEREVLWIRELDTLNKGYNLTIGGLGNPIPTKETLKRMSLSHLGNKYPKISEGNKNYFRNTPLDERRRPCVSKRLKGKKRPPFSDEWKINIGIGQSNSIVCHYNAVIYSSGKEAGIKLGLEPTNISQVLKGRAKHTGGYHFEYVTKDTDIEEIRNRPGFGKLIKKDYSNRPTNKSIRCKENRIVYPSIHEAARQLGLHASNISAILKGIGNHTGNYHFEYIDKRKF